MDTSDFIVCRFMENSIGLKRVMKQCSLNNSGPGSTVGSEPDL